MRRSANLTAAAAFTAVALAFSAAMPGTAAADDVDSMILVPSVTPLVASPGTDVTVEVRVICDAKGNPGGTDHGCPAADADVTVGEVSFEAYTVAPGDTDCSSDGETLLSLGAADTTGSPFSITFKPENVANMDPGAAYFFRLVYTGDSSVTGSHGIENADPLETGCAAVVVQLDVETVPVKTRVSGPLETSIAKDPPLGCHDDIEACTGFASGFVTDPNDAGPIGLNLLHSQHYVVQIELTDGGTLNGHVFTDTFGADWDLDPAAEADWAFGGFPLDGDCGGGGGDCDDGVFDGIHVIESGTADCLVMTDQPPNPNTPKEPEFIDIEVVTLDGTDVCTILIFVQTVENPGGGNEFFEPTGCRILTKGTDIQDTYTLNEGLKEFDASGDRLRGPFDSLQLTCNLPD